MNRIKATAVMPPTNPHFSRRVSMLTWRFGDWSISKFLREFYGKRKASKSRSKAWLSSAESPSGVMEVKLSI